MSTIRQAKGGWCCPGKLPRGPQGRPLCRRCGAEVGAGRRTFCSKACVTEWRIRTDAGFARLKVFERDQGVCGECRIDVFGSVGRTRRSRGSGDLWQADHVLPVAEGGGECGLDNLRTLCTACHRQATKSLMARLAGTA